MTEKIITALRSLDTGNDNHWTTDGQPRIDTVRFLATDSTLNRDTVQAAAPGFNRSTAPTWQPGDPANAQAGSGAAVGEETQSQGVGATMQETTPVVPAQPASAADAAVGDSAGQAEQPTVEVGQSEQPDATQTLQAQLEEALEELNEDEEFLVAAQTRLSKSRAKVDSLKDKLSAVTPKANVSHTIMAYLESQKNILNERAQRNAALKASGLDLKALARGMRSPLDAAMARKTDRGTQRPGS